MYNQINNSEKFGQQFKQFVSDLVIQYRGFFIRFSFAVLALFLSIFVPYLISTDIQYAFIFILIPFAIVGVSYATQWNGAGMGLILAASLFVGFEIGTGTESTVNAGMLTLIGMIGLWAFRLIGNKEDLKVVSSETFIPLLLFLIFSFVSFLVGQIAWYSFAEETSISAQLGGLGVFFLSVFSFWIVSNQVDESRWLKFSLIILISAAFIYFVSRVVPGDLGRVIGLLIPRGASGSMLFLWAGCMALAQGIQNKEMHPVLRGFCLFVPVFAIYVAFFILRGWVSGYLPLFAAILVVLLLTYPKQGILISLIMVAALASQVQSIIQEYVFIGDNSYSLGTRLDAWAILGEITSISPLFGLGPANYYNITPLFPIRGYAVQFNSHSQYVDLYAQTGIIGLVLFLWIFWRVGKLGWRLNTRIEENNFEKAYVVGALGGIVGTLVAAGLGDWVIPFVYNIGFSGFRSSIISWLCMGGIVAVERIINKRQSQTT